MDVLGSCKRTECVGMLGCKRGILGVPTLPAMEDGGAGTCGAAARRREGLWGKVGERVSGSPRVVAAGEAGEVRVPVNGR